MQAAHGLLIAYATAPGSVASDGTGRNGTYTKHLLQYMTVPDLPVEQMLKQVRLAVEQETNGAQTPWNCPPYGAIFFFRPETEARPGFIYPWGNQFDGKHLNFCDRNCDISGKDATVNDDYRFTAPVGHYEAGKSPYRVYDMAGNVWEWVEDGYNEDYYEHSPDHNPPGPAPDSPAVMRGGLWRSGAASVCAARRVGEMPEFRNSDVGLRCAKSP
jgi:hypothetical protein